MAEGRPPDRPLRGMAFQMGALLCFVLMDVSIKVSVADLPVPQVIWARFVVHMATVALVVRLAGRRIPPVSKRPGLQILRSIVLAACNISFSAAIAHVPLAEATSIGFLSPLFTLLLAAVVLKERIGWRAWAAVGLGLVGVLIILRPGLGVTHPAAFLVLGTAALFAVYAILTRHLSQFDDSLTTIFHTGLAATVVTAVAVPFFWVNPDAKGWALLLVIGMLGGFGHYLMILAYTAAPASLLAPFTYVQLLWAALFGWLVFDDRPDLFTWAGAVVIAAGGLLSAVTRRPAPVAPAGRVG